MGSIFHTAFCIAAAMVVLVSGCESPEADAQPFTAETERFFVVPVDLPDGYRLPAHGDQQSSGGQVQAAAWHYFPEDGVRDGWRVVRLCVSLDPEHGHCAVPSGSLLLQESKVVELTARVIAMDVRGDAEPAPGWSDAELTAQWGEVDWLDAR